MYFIKLLLAVKVNLEKCKKQKQNKNEKQEKL